MKEIFFELNQMFENTSGLDHYIEQLEEAHKNEKTIVGIGAGRMGYSLRAHIMRLSHIGFDTYFIGDTSTPRIGPNSLVVINSSSGETPTNVLFAKQAKEAGSVLITITCNKDSTIGMMSDIVVQIPILNSHQLMKSIYEQYSLLLFDYASECLVSKMNLDRDKIIYNHSILE